MMARTVPGWLLSKPVVDMKVVDMKNVSIVI